MSDARTTAPLRWQAGPFRRGESDRLRRDLEHDALNRVRRLWRLRLGRLRLEAQKGEDVGEGVVSVLGGLGEVQGIEVVDVVPHRQEEQVAQQHLEGVTGAVEVPYRRRGAEAHGQVEPQRHVVLRGQEGARMRRVLDRPLSVRREEVVAKDQRRDPQLREAAS